MQLKHGIHLAYCTNIHRGESWPEVFANLETHVLDVRARVAPLRAYGIGLRLGDRASRELAQPDALAGFRDWLEQHRCYVFTINGFPYGQFHGTRVKEQVYAPDWTTPERMEYSLRLFEILAALLPEGMDGSVSTVPGSFKEFITSKAQVDAMAANLWRCVDHLAALRERTGKRLHLDLEPEPLCYVETSEETVRFFQRLQSMRPGDPRLTEHLRVNYDTCHLAIEFEEPAEAIRRFREAGVRIGKLHFSSALKVVPTPQIRRSLEAFSDAVYFHQVVARGPEGSLTRYRDLPLALEAASEAREWRIHYHIPLHCAPAEGLDTTQDHLLGVMDELAADPGLCQHIEMETYTWEVLPPELRQRSVVDQLAGEYAWTLGRLVERGLA